MVRPASCGCAALFFCVFFVVSFFKNWSYSSFPKDYKEEITGICRMHFQFSYASLVFTRCLTHAEDWNFYLYYCLAPADWVGTEKNCFILEADAGLMLPKLVLGCEEKLCLHQTVMEDDTLAAARMVHNRPHSVAGLDV